MFLRNTRSSIVSWGACAEMIDFSAPPSEWFHVMYADKLHNLNIEDLKELKKQGTVSVDFCLSTHSEKEIERIESLLPYIDYAILSIDEAYSITKSKQANQATKKIGKLVNKHAIIHSPYQIYISDGTSLDILQTNYIDEKNMNVLGAGDMFLPLL
jgi:sugar/nucleoside kinase (ribokinase family)